MPHLYSEGKCAQLLLVGTFYKHQLDTVDDSVVHFSVLGDFPSVGSGGVLKLATQ